MKNKCRIKKNDQVKVISGKDKGKTGLVLQVIPKDRKVLVDGINIVKCHKKSDGKSEGGIIEKSLPIDISNVAFLDGDKITKIGYKRLDDGKKVRFAKTSGGMVD